MYPSLVREIVSCRAESTNLHIYDDPVMLSCGHVFCRSCSINFAVKSRDHTAVCPTCHRRIPFENLREFADRLVAHETLATMVKTHLDEQNETIKMKIIQTMDLCEEMFNNNKIETITNLRDQLKTSNEILRQRVNDLEEKFVEYERELKGILNDQEETNEMNFSKHSTIDVQPISKSIDALRKRIDFLALMRVEDEVRQLNDEADRQIRLFKEKIDDLPTFSYRPIESVEKLLLGEFRFQPIRIDQIQLNISGDTSLQSIPSKSPMWSVLLPARPSHLSIYSSNNSTSLFSCSADGILSVLNYQSPVTHESPRLIRTFHLFPNDKHVYVQSFVVFHRFMMIHVYFNEKSLRNRDDFGVLFIFTHDGQLEYKPIPLNQRFEQYVADENRLWTIDFIRQTILFHQQPTSSREIGSCLTKREHFLTFQSSNDFLPYRLTINSQYLAVLARDLEQIYIYEKTSRTLIFTSRFAVGQQMNVSNIGLFPRDQSLLLRFDLSNQENVKRSLHIHFNNENQPIGRIESKNCFTSIVGTGNEILLGFNLRSGIIRCYD